MNPTFEAALRQLAKSEPEKFRFNQYGFFYGRMLKDSENAHFKHIEYTHRINQDSIDEILALIEYGWSVEVCYAEPFGRGSRWQYRIFQCGVAYHYDNTFAFSKRSELSYDTKLSAAKAALIAVVERQYPELSPLEGR